MNAISLNAPPELIFIPYSSPIQYLILNNTCSEKLIFKIRSNHKSAFSMNPTHDFISAYSRKQIPIKLIEAQQGVKLEINYARATQQMILKNDSKMVGVEKKDIKKCLVDLKVCQNTDKKKTITDKKEKVQEVVVSQTDKQVKTNPPLNIGGNQIILDVVKQHPEEDIEELEQLKKNLEAEISSIEIQMQQHLQKQQENRQSIKAKLQENKKKQIMPPYLLFSFLAFAFLLGNFMKKIIYQFPPL